MAKITVRLYAGLREKVGEGRMELAAKNVAEAIGLLKERFGTKFTDQLYEADGKVKDYYLLLLSGHTVYWDKIEETGVKEGDILHIFPPIAGG
jgi:molybdopterin synthase sulfur carrier subunit